MQQGVAVCPDLFGLGKNTYWCVHVTGGEKKALVLQQPPTTDN